MKHFDYVKAQSVNEASELLKAGNAVLSAGATDLLGTLKDNILPKFPEKVVSIKNLSEMDYIREEADGIHIGANTTLRTISDSPVIREKVAALGDAAYSVATPNIRNAATIAGNICQDIRCWYYRYPNNLGGRVNCARKEGHLCYAMMGENRYHSIFGAMKVCQTPCTHECPAHTDIPAYMAKIRENDWDAAARILMRANPIPMLTSRVCPHPCQNGCNQNEYGDSVGIHCVERSVGDYILENIDKFYTAPEAETGKSVGIVGAGPSGLAAAFNLRKAGHKVTVYDKMEKAGGVLMYGIPAYRLPKKYIEAVQTALEKMGVEFVMNTAIGTDITMDELQKKHDSLYVATGAWKQPVLGLNGEELTQFGLNYLVEVNKYLKAHVGKEVLVCGGGNVAMDVALVSKRLGVEKVRLVCLEQRHEMPASPEEIARVLEEGVEFINGRGLMEVIRDENGKVIGMKTNKCLSVRDETGRFNPQYDNDDVMVLESDCIILATGQRVDIDFLGDLKDQIKSPRGLLEVDENNATRYAGVFAGGDAATGPDIAIRAVHAGVNGARAMSAYMGTPISVTAKAETFLMSEQNGVQERVANKLAELPIPERSLTNEDEASYPEGVAKCEASRCMNCGCLAVNPSDMANMLYAYNATIVTNQRTVDAGTFFAGHARIQDTLQKGEVVTEIIVPKPAANTTAVYEKYRLRNAIDFAVVAVASVISKDDEGKVTDANIVLGAVAPVPMKRDAAEAYLKGKTIDEGVAAAAAEMCLEGALPLSDNAYKIDVARALVKRTLLA
ncbi:MAG: FAD binding domain-containing protein [Clostridia bacterium]|nr:FAD binding domain-containing protein [Clostridia bacterium]